MSIGEARSIMMGGIWAITSMTEVANPR
jgi:hypothetical protein